MSRFLLSKTLVLRRSKLMLDALSRYCISSSMSTFDKRQLSSSEGNMNASSFDYPFLNDAKTVEYIGLSKTLFILRGPPGSGKSTLATAIQEKYPGKAAVCSAQSHLPLGQKPPFSKQLLEGAHSACVDCVRKHCEEGRPVVVVDNTSLTLREIQKYSAIGHEWDYIDVVVSLQTKWCYNAEELVRRSSRDFPLETIQRKVKAFKTPLYPLFYGWFLNTQDSEKLKSLGQRFYEQCIKNASFKEEFSKYRLPDAGGEHRDLQHYFSMAAYVTGPSLLHCTAFFCNNGAVSQSEAYSSREAVMSGNSKVFQLGVIGLLITPRSLGIRLKLHPVELPLWDSEDDAPKKRTREGVKSSAGGGGADDECIITPLSPTCGTGSRAHLSIGSGPGVEPVQTGLDLIEIIKWEQAAEQSGKEKVVIELDEGCARCFGDGNWMVYFKEELFSDALFSAYF